MSKICLVAPIVCFLAASAAAQPPFAPIPGYNVGLNPSALVTSVSWQGRPAFAMLVPGGEDIATFFDPSLMPPGTTEVHLTLENWAVYEPNSCAVGAGLFIDTQNQFAASPRGYVHTTGWNLYRDPVRCGYSSRDPILSNWYLHYCSVMGCTSPCGGLHRNPDFELYLVVPELR